MCKHPDMTKFCYHLRSTDLKNQGFSIHDELNRRSMQVTALYSSVP